MTFNELVLSSRGSYVCANFDENRSRNVTVGVLADRLTDANRFYNLSHAICYSYGIDNEVHSGLLEVFFSSRVVTRWNMLDQQIVVATILNAFKNE